MAKVGSVAITGATGFLGSHLTESLLQAGMQVHMLARNASKAAAYKDRVAKCVVGDINDRAALQELVQGCDAVVHLVSNFRTASGPPDSYTHINVDGTAAIINAAKEAKIQRFVHCSTIGVHGHVKCSPANEKSIFAPGDLYQQTKLTAEQLVRAQIGQSNMEIVIIRPCSLYGPGDLRMLKMFKMLSKGRFFLVGPCRENFHAVYIDDVIAGFNKALLQPGIGGETFILGGPQYVPLFEYINIAAAAVGASPPRLRLPYWMMYSSAVLCEWICVPMRIEPPLHRRRVRFFRNNRAFDIAKAQQVLQFNATIDLPEGMARTVSWYRSEGLMV